MAKYRVFMHTVLSMSVDVEFDDADMDSEEATDRAIDRAYEEMPSDLCAHCSGWRTPWSRDFGEWELDESTPQAPAVTKIEESDR